MSQEQESILIEPSFKAYPEYIAAGVIMLYYGVGLFVLLWVLYTVKTRSYTVMDDRIIIQRGLFKKTTQTLRIAAIRDVIAKQGTLQKHFDVGDVRILTRDNSMPALDIHGIPHPQQFKALITQYRQALAAAQSAKSGAAA